MKSSIRKEPGRYFSVAYIKHHEGRGWFLIDLLTEKAERFKSGKKFFLAPPLFNLGELTVKEVKRRSRRLYLCFFESEQLTRPEVLANRYLQIPLNEAKELEPDEYWVHEIVGLDCYNLEGKYLGKVTSVMKTGANDVFFIDDGKYLIPAVKEVIKEVSIKKGKLIIKELPGLLEL